VKHGWNSLEDYLYQYHRRLEDYPGFIEDYTFSADPVFENERDIVSINMEIFCINKTRITVVKTAQVKLQPFYSSLRGARRRRGNLSRRGPFTRHCEEPAGDAAILRWHVTCGFVLNGSIY
jgi:hypothetical protein